MKTETTSPFVVACCAQFKAHCKHLMHQFLKEKLQTVVLRNTANLMNQFYFYRKIETMHI